MKNFCFSVFFIFVVTGCKPEKTIYIKGALSGTNAEKIFLRELGNENVSAYDTDRKSVV